MVSFGSLVLPKDLVVGFHLGAGLFERNAALVESVLDDFEFFLDDLKILFKTVKTSLLVERTTGRSLIATDQADYEKCHGNDREVFHIFPLLMNIGQTGHAGPKSATKYIKCSVSKKRTNCIK